MKSSLDSICLNSLAKGLELNHNSLFILFRCNVYASLSFFLTYFFFLSFLVLIRAFTSQCYCFVWFCFSLCFVMFAFLFAVLCSHLEMNSSFVRSQTEEIRAQQTNTSHFISRAHTNARDHICITNIICNSPLTK